jgi:mono/diheme cytochrome c family protein
VLFRIKNKIYVECALLLVLFFSCKTSTDKNTDQTTDLSNVNWSEHIAHIIYQNCSPCHRPNQSGPFNLLSYKDAVKKAKQIKFVTGTRYMPPWPADANYSHFIGERILSDDQIAMIKTWVEKDTPRGDSLKEPKVPVFNDLSFFGKPDLVVRAQKGIEIKYTFLRLLMIYIIHNIVSFSFHTKNVSSISFKIYIGSTTKKNERKKILGLLLHFDFFLLLLLRCSC